MKTGLGGLRVWLRGSGPGWWGGLLLRGGGVCGEPSRDLSLGTPGLFPALSWIHGFPSHPASPFLALRASLGWELPREVVRFSSARMRLPVGIPNPDLYPDRLSSLWLWYEADLQASAFLRLYV